MTNKPEQLPEWRKSLNEAVENYQSTRAWYEENQDSPSAEQDMDAAAGEIEKLIKQYGVLIVLNLLDEIDELQERREADSTESVSFDELNAAVAEVTGCNQHAWNANIYKGHQAVPFINFNSLARIVDKYRVPQPAKSLELAGWQFKSVNGDWLGLIDEHGKNQAVREGCEVREVFAIADSVNDREQVRREHAKWSQDTFGNVGPVGPLKHLSKEALEAAAEPGDLSEWADMQFLLWDAQRHAGISDEQITQAMVEKLAVNKQREWPEPKDGEPRLHIKAQPAPVVPDEKPMPEASKMHAIDAVAAIAEVRGWNACRAAMLQAGSSPVTPDGYLLVPIVPTEDMIINGFESEPDELFSKSEEWDAYQEMSGCEQAAHRAKLCWAAMIKAAPKQENI